MFGHEGMTTSSELQQIGRQLFGNKFIGVYAQNCLPMDYMKQNKYAIINTDKKRDSRGRLNKGTHWVSIASDNNGKILIFDSFGRPTSKLLKHLYNQMKKNNIKYQDTEYDQEQHWIQENCGQLCMTWLKYFDMYGLEKAKWI